MIGDVLTKHCEYTLSRKNKKNGVHPKVYPVLGECLLADAVLECLKVFLRTYEAVLLFGNLTGDRRTVTLDGILESLGRLVRSLLALELSLDFVKGLA